jgi:hypothetical protein
MTGMKFIGPDPRAAELRRAANRLRWEIDFALEDGRRDYEVPGCLGDIAETMAILRQIMETLDKHVPANNENFRALLEFYKGYHVVGR